jgi:proteasome lid subunit RPN8/RPN11
VVISRRAPLRARGVGALLVAGAARCAPAASARCWSRAQSRQDPVPGAIEAGGLPAPSPADRFASLGVMVIASDLLDELIAHARAEAPNECCGMIATEPGAHARAVRVYRATNAAASPLRYEIDGMEQYRIQTDIEDAGLALGAIYHSHTRSAPYPSQTDINLAFYPESLYVIVGVAEDEPDVRAYRIVDGRVEEAALAVR